MDEPANSCPWCGTPRATAGEPRREECACAVSRDPEAWVRSLPPQRAPRQEHGVLAQVAWERRCYGAR